MRTIHLLPKYQEEFLKKLDGRFSCNSPFGRKPENEKVSKPRPRSLES